MRSVTGSAIDLRFPGQWFQSESGLHQNWMRDYDPTTGRYLEADPLGLVDGASVYGYALQSPLRHSDSRGEFVTVAVGAAIGAAVGYYDTGCWQGALAGAAIGALAGAVTPALATAIADPVVAGAATGAGASAASQIANNSLAGVCGCRGESKPLPELLASPEFMITTALGSAGGSFGGVVGSESSTLAGWAAGHVSKRVAAEFIAGITSIFPSYMGDVISAVEAIKGGKQ